MNEIITLGIDIGGTKIATAIVNQEGKILFRNTTPTLGESAEELFSALISNVEYLFKKSKLTIKDIKATGVGVPGKVDIQKGIAVSQNNIPWNNFPIVERLKKEFGKNMKIVMDNDVKVATFAEYKMSNPSDDELFTYITISTGVAKSSIINNQFIRGAGFSGEIGFLPLIIDNKPINLEKYAAGPAIGKAYPGNISTKEVFDKYYEHDDKAIEIIHNRAMAYAYAVYTIVCVIDPHNIVLGGSVAYNNPLFVEKIVEYLEALVSPEQSHILSNIKISTLGGDNGVIGAALLAHL